MGEFNPSNAGFHPTRFLSGPSDTFFRACLAQTVGRLPFGSERGRDLAGIRNRGEIDFHTLSGQPTLLESFSDRGRMGPAAVRNSYTACVRFLNEITSRGMSDPFSVDSYSELLLPPAEKIISLLRDMQEADGNLSSLRAVDTMHDLLYSLHQLRGSYVVGVDYESARERMSNNAGCMLWLCIGTDATDKQIGMFELALDQHSAYIAYGDRSALNDCDICLVHSSEGYVRTYEADGADGADGATIAAMSPIRYVTEPHISVLNLTLHTLMGWRPFVNRVSVSRHDADDVYYFLREQLAEVSGAMLPPIEDVSIWLHRHSVDGDPYHLSLERVEEYFITINSRLGHCENELDFLDAKKTVFDYTGYIVRLCICPNANFEVIDEIIDRIIQQSMR
jgi:hypothetical protein